MNEGENVKQWKQKTEQSINVTSECECHKNSFPLWHTNSIYETLSQIFLAELVRQVLQVFKDKPISRATIFPVLKDCRDGKIQEN